MKIIISNEITIEHPNFAILDYCDNRLTFTNPEFNKKERMGFWTGNTPKKVHLFYRRGNDVVIPFGCLQDIWKLYPVANDYEVKIKKIKNIEFPEPLYKPYPYQEEAITAMIAARNGILKSPCGSGKSMMAMEIIRRLGCKALFLCHTLDLIKQAKTYAYNHLNLKDEQVGEITGGKVNIGTHITFATRQTLARMDLSQFKDEWDVIIVDEAQNISYSIESIKQYSKILNSLCARYKYGLSATPFSSDGIDKAIFCLVGDVKFEVNKEKIADKTIKAKVKVINTDYYPSEDILSSEGTVESNNDLLNDIAEDYDRNLLIANDIKENMAEGHCCLVLSDRIKHLTELRELVGEGEIITGKMDTKASREKRVKVLEGMKYGEYSLLFASYPLAKEGLDIPRLDRLFLASPKRNKAAIIQSVGRIERAAENKSTPIVYDYVDTKFKYTDNMFNRTRKSIYRKNGNEII